MALDARLFRIGTPDAKTNPRSPRLLHCNHDASSTDSLGSVLGRSAAVCVAWVVTIRLEELPAFIELELKAHAVLAGNPVQLRLIGLLNAAPTDANKML